MISFPRLAATVVFSTAAIALAAEGCGSGGGRYYCDQTGCFECDGYGCTPVKPPTPQTCTGNESCATNEVCTDKGCARKCGTNDDCAKGLVCDANSHLCIAPGTNPGNTIACKTKADCKGGVCVVNAQDASKNKCVACGGQNGPCICDANNACDAGLTCSNGYCIEPSNTCKYSSECAQGKVCADGECLTDCSMGQMCPNGQVCDAKGYCKVVPMCTSASDCGMNQLCANGTCSPKCTDNTQCANGYFCDQGACVVDNRPVAQCGINGSMCGANQMCIGGFCKYSCSTDQECKLIDARIGYCGKDKVCRTAAEAMAECLSSSDCTGGKICVANACK